MNHSEKLRTLLDRLVDNGESLSKKTHRGRTGLLFLRNKEAVERWSAELKLFVSLAGDLIDPWRENLQHDGYTYAHDMRQPLASLRTIQFALDEGLLTRFEDLVIADVFGDLIEQADYLLDQNYFLAAGVIFRAVLEERLLRMCERNTCAPEKKKSTINSYNMALYAAQPRIYDKGIMQNVTSLATIGNNAAHNSDELKMEDVDRLPGNCFFTPDVWLLAEAGILEGVQRNPKEITGLTSNP